MKKIFICIFGLVLLSSAYYFLHLHVTEMSEIYVENKKENLHKEFYDKLKEYWAGETRLMFSEEFSGAYYVPMDLDAVRQIDNRDENNFTYYSSLERLFPYDRFPMLIPTMFKCLKPGCFKHLYELNAVKDLPWEAFMLKYQEKDRFEFFVFKPVAVGYLKSSYNLIDWRPSCDESCASALNFLIKESRDYKDCYNQDNKKTINKILSLYNRYYYLQEEYQYKNASDLFINFEEIKLPKHPENDPTSGHQISWIYNGFYRVYYDTYPLQSYKVAFNRLNYNKDKQTYYTEHFFVIKICFWIIFFILFVYLLYQIWHFSKYRSKTNISGTEVKIDLDTLYNEIIEKADPKKFIEPYQPDKLAIANEIFSQALKNRYNRNVLEGLLNRINKEL